MIRRVLLFVALAACLRADSADEAWNAISDAARALSEATALAPPLRGDASGFLAYFDKSMPGYDTLRTNATALLQEVDVQSTVDLLENSGDDRAREVELTWALRLVDTNGGVASTRREERVKCRVEKRGKKWKIVSFTPIALFAPPGA